MHATRQLRQLGTLPAMLFAYDPNEKDNNMTQQGKTIQNALSLLASAALLITVCFAPVMAQTKEQSLNDHIQSYQPITKHYLA
jgi:ribosomal protein L25 (general stress protein Ctc)